MLSRHSSVPHTAFLARICIVESVSAGMLDVGDLAPSSVLLGLTIIVLLLSYILSVAIFRLFMDDLYASTNTEKTKQGIWSMVRLPILKILRKNSRGSNQCRYI